MTPPRRPAPPDRPADAAKADQAAPHQPQPVDIAHESVAGEEDPGAAIELAVKAAKRRQADQPAGNRPANAGSDSARGERKAKGDKR